MANIQLHNDTRIKIEYDEQLNKYGFLSNCIGSNGIITPLVQATQITEAIYVNASLGDDVNVGTYASPKATIGNAISSCTVGFDRVIIYGSDDYIGELASVTNIFFQGLYLLDGETARVSLRDNGLVSTDANTIYVNKTGNDSNAGGIATPCLTIAAAGLKCTGSKTTVLITDSETYNEESINMTGSFVNLYSNEFCSPTITSKEAVTIVSGTSNAVYGMAYGTITTMPNGDYVVISVTGAQIYTATTYDKSGNVVTATWEIMNATVGYPGQNNLYAVNSISDTTIAIVYTKAGGGTSTVLKKVDVYSKADTTVTNIAATIAKQPIETQKLLVLANGNLAMVAYNTYSAATAVNHYLMVLSQAGAIVTAPTTVFNTVSASNGTFSNVADLIQLTNGNIAIYHHIRVAGITDIVVYLTIVNQSGAVVSASAAWNGISDTYFTVESRDGFGIYYGVTGTTGRFIKFNIDTQMILSTWSANPYASIVNPMRIVKGDYTKAHMTVLDRDAFTGGGTPYAIYDYPTFISQFRMNAGTSINGLSIGTPGTLMTTVVSGSGAVSIKHIDQKDILWTYFLRNFTAYNITLYNNVIYSGSNTYSTNLQVFNNIFANCLQTAIYNVGAAGASGNITIEHNDFFDNASGVYLVTNNGANEIIKNNNFKGNGGYGIWATTTVTQSYGINTDVNYNCTTGTSISTLNPLYINEGSLGIAYINLRLKNQSLGYPLSSPALLRADDNRNSGAYDEIVIGSASSYSSGYLAKPETINIERSYANPVNVQLSDGSYDTYKQAQTEIIELRWKNIIETEYILLDTIMCSDTKVVRVYFEPDTNPYVSYQFSVMRNSWKASSSYSITNNYGKSDVAISLARRYTL